MIGIVFDEKHPLLDKIAERLAAHDQLTRWIPWHSLAWADGSLPALAGCEAIYLDRLGEKAPTYATQLDLLAGSSYARLTMNAPAAYRVARDKALSAAVLSAHGLPAPRTLVFYSLDQLEGFCAKPRAPYIVKPLLGACAHEVVPFFAGSLPYAAIGAILQRDGMAIAQEFVRNDVPFLWRVDVVGGRVVECNRRSPFTTQGLPLCNGTHGGAVDFLDPGTLDPRVAALALSAVSTFGLDVAGVDILPCEDGGLYLAEVNPEPTITVGSDVLPYAIADHLHASRRAA